MWDEIIPRGFIAVEHAHEAGPEPNGQILGLAPIRYMKLSPRLQDAKDLAKRGRFRLAVQMMEHQAREDAIKKSFVVGF